MTESPQNFNHNDIVYNISEVSQAIKRMVEDHFGYVKLRGEISGFKQASSGHAYFKLKDDQSVIDAVCWKGTVSKLPMRPEDGLEVIASGKLTTYPGRSSYQIVVSHMEPAGEGALMAMLEKRRKQLEAEGLFAATRKKPLPYMPRRVGVVTSPTGAVIRDILHRISDRFPCHVLVWPVPVQGEGAAEKIARAIAGFNQIGEAKPDVIIVARGGGSLEDLWAFNEEVVVRAAADSIIPLISAVGHETDTTLIDYASDRRAPTPTAAAEMAVPVLAELKLVISQLDARIMATVNRQFAERGQRLEGLLRGLPKPQQLLQVATQRLDDWGERMQLALPILVKHKTQQLHLASQGLKINALQKEVMQQVQRSEDYLLRLNQSIKVRLQHKFDRLEALAARLESVNVERILERGFVLVRGQDGALVTSSKAAKTQSHLELQFADGRLKAIPS